MELRDWRDGLLAVIGVVVGVYVTIFIVWSVVGWLK